jgi:exonuclease VII small subunit
MEAESGRMSGIAAQIELGAVEVSSLSEAFGHGVHLFSESNEKLMDALGRIEDALSASTARSDEQLAYYVAQAREVIDLSIMSQKQVIEDLQGLAGRTAPTAGGA